MNGDKITMLNNKIVNKKKRDSFIRLFPRILLHFVLSAGGLLMTLPFIWMIVSSFKPAIDIISVPFRFFPEEWTLGNYIAAIKELNLLRGYINSFIVSSSITVLVLFSSSIAGFLFSKLRFKGKEVLFVYVLASLMVPPQIIIIPFYFFMVKMNLVNTYVSLILPFAMMAFGIFMMRQFIEGVPDSLLDAARIDGTSTFKIYYKIILPLTKSAFSVLGILTFIWNWDLFLWPLVTINTNNMKTLPIILAHFTMGEGSYFGKSMAAVTLIVIPVLIVYVFFQRYFVKGMAMTGLKY